MADDRQASVVRGDLQNVSIEYKNDEEFMIADDVFPLIDGLDQRTKVTKHSKGPMFRDEAQVRAPGTAAQLIQRAASTDNITPTNYAAAGMVTDEERAEAKRNNGMVLEPDIDAISLIANSLDIKKEVRAAAVVHATDWAGVGAGGEDAGGLWGAATTAANDTFLADIRKARDAVRALTGKILNSAAMTWECWSALQISLALRNIIYPTTITKNALVTKAALEALIGMKIVVAGGIKSTAEETKAQDDFTPVSIWGAPASPAKGACFLYYRPTKPGLRQVSAGYQYRVKQVNGQGRMTTRWYDKPTHTTYYDTQENTEFANVCDDAAYLFIDTALT